MVEVVLTADDLRLADEMNHLYGAKAKEDLSDNEVEFLRLFVIKNRSEACVRKLKLLIKLYRQEKRFLAVKGKTENMLKRERDAKQKQFDRLAFILGHGLINTIKDESSRAKEHKRFRALNFVIIKMCAFGIVDRKDWIVVQDFLFKNKPNIEQWLEFTKKSFDEDSTEYQKIQFFLEHYSDSIK